jgi:hypothetical protein
MMEIAAHLLGARNDMGGNDVVIWILDFIAESPKSTSRSEGFFYFQRLII